MSSTNVNYMLQAYESRNGPPDLIPVFYTEVHLLQQGQAHKVLWQHVDPLDAPILARSSDLSK